MQIHHHPGPVGAIVTGLSLQDPLDDATFNRIGALILDRAVVSFAGQDHLDEAGQVAFSRRFGALVPSELDGMAPAGFPDIFIVSNAIRDGKPLGAREVGRHWHTDFQHLKAAAALTMLHARKIPPEKGDTEFADMRAAYDALPEATKARIDGLEVLHSRVKAWPVMFPDRPPLTPEKAARTPDVVHPLVRIHPQTGRRSLYVTANKAAWEIIGMKLAEGQALLAELLEWSVQERFRFTHIWQPNDYLVWENRCLLHRATPFDAERYERIMYRTTIAGDPTFGPPRRDAAARGVVA